jgi:hypothetical protein
MTAPTTAIDEGAIRTMPMSLGMVGILMILLGVWGGIVPYVGPIFGYSADGSSSWVWNSSHGILALVPGAAGVVAGLIVLSRASRSTVGGGRIGLAFAGLLATAAGGWFVIGPPAWRVIHSTTYFVSAAPLRELAFVVGYSLGVGLLLVWCGAFVVGWAVRHQRRSSVAAVGGGVPVTSAAAPVAASSAAPVAQAMGRRRFRRGAPAATGSEQPPVEPVGLTGAPPAARPAPASYGSPSYGSPSYGSPSDSQIAPATPPARDEEGRASGPVPPPGPVG